MALDWEANWNKVDKQTAELEQKFKEVESVSKKYLTALDQLTKGIKDTKQRAEEARKNRDAKQEWDKAYADARKQIDRARSLRDKGNDLKKVILLAAMRGKIAEATATLDSITMEAQSLLVTLEALTAQGKSLVKKAKPGAQGGLQPSGCGSDVAYGSKPFGLLVVEGCRMSFARAA